MLFAHFSVLLFTGAYPRGGGRPSPGVQLAKKMTMEKLFTSALKVKKTGKVILTFQLCYNFFKLIIFLANKESFG